MGSSSLRWGAGGDLERKGPFLKADWSVPTPVLLLYWFESTSISRFSGSPLVQNFFLWRGGGIELQANSCNRSPRQPWRRKHSIIHTSVPDTRLCDTKIVATKRGTLVFLFCFITKQVNRQKHGVMRHFSVPARMKTWGDFSPRLTCHLVCRPVVSPKVKGNTKRWVLVSCDQVGSLGQL